MTSQAGIHTLMKYPFGTTLSREELEVASFERLARMAELFQKSSLG